jgi:hypothetical protein
MEAWMSAVAIHTKHVSLSVLHEFMCLLFRGFQSLIDRIEPIFEVISGQVLDKVFESWPRRVQDCINSEGSYIRVFSILKIWRAITRCEIHMEHPVNQHIIAAILWNGIGSVIVKKMHSRTNEVAMPRPRRERESEKKSASRRRSKDYSISSENDVWVESILEKKHCSYDLAITGDDR